MLYKPYKLFTSELNHPDKVNLEENDLILVSKSEISAILQREFFIIKIKKIKCEWCEGEKWWIFCITISYPGAAKIKLESKGDLSFFAKQDEVVSATSFWTCPSQIFVIYILKGKVKPRETMF